MPSSILDRLMPDFDFRERHALHVRAASAETWAALERTNLAAGRMVKGMLMMRALPGAMLAGHVGLRRLRAAAGEPVTLATLEAQGFRRLATDPPRELVLGLEGKFWRPGGGLCAPESVDFVAPPAPGHARAAWNFRLEVLSDGLTLLSTETRVLCADASARRRFRPYWILIRPASGLLRREMLRAIRRAAERP